MVKALLKVKEINVNVEDSHGWIPSYWAAYHEHVDMVKILVKNRTNSLLKDENGNTPGDLSKDNSIKNLPREGEETQLRALKKSIFHGGVIALLGTTAAVALFATGTVAIELIPIVMAVATIVTIALAVGSITYVMLKPNTEMKKPMSDNNKLPAQHPNAQLP